MNGIFTESLGESPLVGTKPGTKGMEYIMNKYNLCVGEILYVGDSHVDMEFAHAANVKVVACMYGYERIYDIMIIPRFLSHMFYLCEQLILAF